METAKPHVAILASPGMGHVTPCLELAKCLASHHSVEVSLFVPSTESSIHQTKLLQSLSLPQDLHIINLPPVDLSDVSDITNIAACITLIVQKSLPSFRSAILESPRPPRVFISDFFSSYAFDIADELNMEKYLFSTTNARVLAYLFYCQKLADEVDYNEADGPGEYFEVPGCKPVLIEEDLGGRLMDRDQINFQCMLGHLRNYVRASGFLVNTFEDLEPDTLHGLSETPMPPLYPVGPLIQSGVPQSADSKADCLTWLDNQPRGSVLFIAFGSGGALSAEQINELAWGLELSKQRFLWVVRRPQELAPAAAYLAAGAGHDDPSKYLPDGFLTRTRDIGLVVPNWAPQVEILSHESVGAFMSHCGWNSTLESLVHGVPLITWQLYAEQHWNAFLLTKEIGVAVRLANAVEKDGVIGRERVERAIKSVMEEEKGKAVRKRANELKDSAIRALEKGGSSYTSLSKLVKTWNFSSRD